MRQVRPFEVQIEQWVPDPRKTRAKKPQKNATTQVDINRSRYDTDDNACEIRHQTLLSPEKHRPQSQLLPHRTTRLGVRRQISVINHKNHIDCGSKGTETMFPVWYQHLTYESPLIQLFVRRKPTAHLNPHGRHHKHLLPADWIRTITTSCNTLPRR